MTGRERLTAILQKKPKDRMSWAPLMDHHTLSRLPGRLKDTNMLDFCRHLGADLFLLSGWGTPYGFRSPELRWGEDVRMTSTQDPQNPLLTINEWQTSKGKLVAVSRQGHPLKYPVDTIEAVRLYRQMWEGATFVGHDDTAAFAAIEAALGKDGVTTCFWGPSTIPRLLEIDMGTENFYLLYFDYPEEMDGLIRLMHERELKAFEYIAQGPYSSATLVENTSTFYVSPDIYTKYNMPHQRDFVEAVHRHGKTALLHMCGHVQGILKTIKETGCDGIHALTPPPTGNTPWEEALNVIGEDLIIFSALDPTVWISGPIREIGPTLDRLITLRLREANFILGPFADGIPVPLERFEAISRWIEASL